jgi:hypothetical protein
MEESTDLSGIDSPPEPPTNDIALISFLTGVGGWVLAFIGICPFVSAFTGGFSGVGCTLLSFIAWIIAIPAGYMARQQITKRGEGGDNLARIGMMSGIAGIGITVLLFCVVLGAVLAGALTLPFLD